MFAGDNFLIAIYCINIHVYKRVLVKVNYMLISKTNYLLLLIFNCWIDSMVD